MKETKLGECLQGIYSVSGECMEGVKGVSGRCYESGRFLDDRNLSIKGLLVLLYEFHF